MLESIVLVILKVLWRLAADTCEDYLETQRRKRAVIDQTKEIMNETVAVDPESVDDSFLRLERLAAESSSSDSIGAKWTSIFGAFDPDRASRAEGSLSGESAEVSPTHTGDSEDTQAAESSGGEPVDSGPDGALPPT